MTRFLKLLSNFFGRPTERANLLLAVISSGSILAEHKLNNFANTRNVTRDITRSMKGLETEVVELQTLAESTGDRGLLDSAIANLATGRYGTGSCLCFRDVF